LVLIGTFVAPLTLIVPLTVGGVVSGEGPVVQLHTKSLAIAFPARSFTPPTPPLTVAVYRVLGERLLAGAKTALTPE
jgi:hypothetical protein